MSSKNTVNSLPLRRRAIVFKGVLQRACEHAFGFSLIREMKTSWLIWAWSRQGTRVDALMMLSMWIYGEGGRLGVDIQLHINMT